MRNSWYVVFVGLFLIVSGVVSLRGSASTARAAMKRVAVAAVQVTPTPTFNPTLSQPPVGTPPGDVPPSDITLPSAPLTIPLILPKYELSPSAAPVGFVTGLVGSAWPGNTGLTPFRSPQFLAAFSAGRMVGYVDQASGDAEVFSDLQTPRPSTLNTAGAVAIAERIFADPNVIPKDATTFKTSTTTLQKSENISLGGKAGAAAGVLTYVSLRRYVARGLFPVFGVGSRAVVAIDGRGQVQGFLRSWRTARSAGVVVARVPATAIQKAILTQLTPFLTSSIAIHVDRIGIGYYDGGGSSLEPVVYYFATMRHRHVEVNGPAPDHFVGYLSINNQLENITMRFPVGRRPLRITAERAGGSARSASDPSVATFVTRHAESAWGQSAESFWAGISATSNAADFSRQEENEAEPPFFLGEKNAHVNHVNIADTEGHGGWWIFSTSGDAGDIVDVRNIKEGGYGAAPTAGGNLAYWVIHACEVIPSQWDLRQRDGSGDGSAAFGPWWSVFGGLREVLGYRTQMYINDGVEHGFGEDMGRGGIALSSWFNHVAAATIYQANPTCHSDAINADVTCGRASAIVVAGHQNDAMLKDYKPLTTRAKKLVNFWMVDR